MVVATAERLVAAAEVVAPHMRRTLLQTTPVATEVTKVVEDTVGEALATEQGRKLTITILY